ncbi:unnamed protein product [Paramecium primaurelia]|uniref:Rhomboid-like protease n=1 Tax=Paramecium primaurelia TaxID=5886 RepID=A0A8S1MIW8_PARPR|nr:unnamed protein product [Paramecium primaurelia]
MQKRVSDITTLKIRTTNPNDISQSDQPFFNQRLDQTRDNIQIPQSIQEILFPNFQLRSLTSVIALLLTLNYICQYIYYKVSGYKYFGCVLYELGAFYAADVIYEYEFYRYITGTLYFGSIYNAIIFVITFTMEAYTLEYMLGKFVICIYLNAGIYGLIFSALIYKNSITTGNCGIIFTILVLYGSNLIKKYHEMENAKAIIGLYCILLILNFLTILETQNTNIGIVIGGIINGFGISIFIHFRHINEKTKKVTFILLFVIFSVEIMLFGLLQNIDVDKIFKINLFC